jgi:hypothetical protein
MFNQHKTESSQQLSSTQPMMSEEESLTTKFNKYNDLIFSSKLPIPRLKWSRGKTRLGQMACKRKRSWGRTTFYDYTISVSRYYNLTEEQIDDVLIHEMIHYFIAYTGLKDTSAHGVIFRGMMDKINRTFNRHITISVRTRNLHLQSRTTQQAKDYLILALETKDGKYFLSSVNPSAAGKLAISLARAREIAHYAWYQSQDEYFRSMPRVRSLRGRQVSAEVYETMIEKMKLQR